MSEVKKVPEIRFAGFAEPWEQRKLGELSSSFEYGLNAAAKEYDGKNKYIRITDIDDDNREFKQENITSPDTDLSFAENYRLSEGDILFARTGASVGKSYIYKASDGLVYYAGFLIRARIKPEYNSEFVFQNTLTGDYEKFIKVTSMRSGQPGVNAQEYSQYQIMVPGKPEQDMISAYLQSLDNLIILHQRKHEKLVALKKAMLEKMFPPKGNNVPEVRFAGFTGSWERRKVSELADFSKGSGYSKGDLKENGTPIILYGRLYTKYQFEIGEVDTFADIKPGSVFSKGDEVIVPASGETAEDIAIAAAVVKPGILLGGDLNILHPFGFMNPSFVALSISNGQPQKELARKAQGKSVVHVHNSDIQEVTICYPDREEQDKIVSVFSQLDNLITLHQRKHESLKRVKAALLQKMFV